MSGAHPSFFALDRLSLGHGDPSVEHHLQHCAQCQAHVRQERQPLPVPVWVSAIQVPPSGLRQPWRSPRAWRGAFPALLSGPLGTWLGTTQALFAGPWKAWCIPGLATALAVALFAVGPRDPAPTRSKGAPAWAVHIHRGGTTHTWDGAETVRAGDRLRLEVASGGLTHLQVFDGVGTLLYGGQVPPGVPELLPEAWEVDAEGTAESLWLVLTREPADPAPEPLREVQSADRYAHRILLRKAP